MEGVKLSMLAGETIEATEATAKRITIDCEIDDALPSARANPERLQRVLFNLLTNAIRHTPAGGTITIFAQMVNAALEIEVADTGTGIPEAERGHVFDAFRQGGDRAARGGNGAGLGLAISRAIVEAHDGHIWLEPACAVRVCGSGFRSRRPEYGEPAVSCLPHLSPGASSRARDGARRLRRRDERPGDGSANRHWSLARR